MRLDTFSSEQSPIGMLRIQSANVQGGLCHECLVHPFPVVAALVTCKQTVVYVLKGL